MNNNELAAQVAEQVGISAAKVREVIGATFDAIAKAIQGAADDVKVHSFGTFKGKHREARMGRNPSTGKNIEIAAKYVPVFVPTAGLKELVNTPRRRGRR